MTEKCKDERKRAVGGCVSGVMTDAAANDGLSLFRGPCPPELTGFFPQVSLRFTSA